jgi:lipopolysaccharide/colanic/teichoic acid biosynthesis glycosyltransferase
MRTIQVQSVYDEPIVTLDDSSAAAESTYPLYALPAEAPVDSWRYRFVKRSFDILFALLMAAAFAVPCLVIAALIRITTNGPIFYREERIGREGVPFRIWKFRSMRPTLPARSVAGARAERVVLQWRMKKHHHDPRITRIGGFLRRWSLDELPQILNVLRGEMSLIGPRPIIEAETSQYRNLLRFYLAATPGLSGLWQVSGRSDIDYEERAKLDASYVCAWSLRLDFKILLRTIPAVLGRVGAR